MPHKDPTERREYHRQYMARRYAENAEHREYHKRTVRNRIQELKRLLRDYKDAHPCIDCGEADPDVLDFHHRVPAEKTTELTAMVQRGFSWERILVEIEKCDVVCANCHRRRHARARRTTMGL